ncbi:linear amide C-N hydrolase [Shewanella surugensis]|uniref:Linear amide C-N hydrolase n=1 Tax=Shewanella surugensis TaxID=212020 RepID=A0ABT0LEP1_9GAMM|nr:linear amide C-N hydrolase [Shewanella surugensis]MCL1125955.1 linear amide C-N hydrolase [Shewanella surugensis]
MCTRVLYTCDENQTYTGRNMDWFESPKSQIWAYPALTKRDGAGGSNSPCWQSKYSSITTANYNIATSDGINEKGLTANLLWLANSQYPNPQKSQSRRPMSISIWAQYILDLCETVEDAINAMDNVYIVTAVIPEAQRKALCHLSIGDKAGNSAIFEYIDGILHISSNVDLANPPTNYFRYTKTEVKVMTNEPTFSEQLKFNAYWQAVNNSSLVALPGTSSSEARFVRASYYSKNLVETVDQNEALAGLFSVMHNAARPIGKEEVQNDSPNESRTWYSSFAVQNKPTYYFQSMYSPFLIWLHFDEIKFPSHACSENLGLHLSLNENGVSKQGGKVLSGNVVDKLTLAKTFDFLPANH